MVSSGSSSSGGGSSDNGSSNVITSNDWIDSNTGMGMCMCVYVNVCVCDEYTHKIYYYYYYIHYYTSSTLDKVWEIYDPVRLINMGDVEKRAVLRCSGVSGLPRPREGVGKCRCSVGVV